MVSDSLNNKSTEKRLRPRLNLQWLVLVLALVSIPWLGYRFVAETRVFLVEGQILAQEQLAQGVVTLFQGRSDLLAELPYLDSQQVVFSHTLVKPAKVDGHIEEWLDFQLLAHHFDTGDIAEDGYSLLLGEYGDYIYGLVKVKDNLTVLRQPDHHRLDTSDHLRLSLPDRYGNERRLLLVAEQPGIMQAWYVKEDWATRKYNYPSSNFIIQAVMRPILDGYLVEFALPNYFLNERQEFGLAVVDVDDDLVQHLKTLVNPTQTTIESHYNLLAMSSPEANRMLEKIDRANSQIVVYDSQLLIRASVGQLVSQSTDANQLLSPLEWLQNLGNKVLRQLGQWFDYFAPVVDINQEQILLQQGKDKKYARGRWHTSEGEEIIANVAPIIDETDDLLGVVMIKQSTRKILRLQSQAMENIVLFSFLTVLGIVLALWLFFWRLAWRIRRLRREAQQMIDAQGRLQVNRLHSETLAHDEIGDLARSFSSVVARLHEHQIFLSNMPRTLRHEINNPLNAINTSLENLQRQGIETGQQRYLNAAQRGLFKISAIVEKLSDAANLEDALAEDELEPLDLRSLVQTYVYHQNRATHQSNTDIIFLASAEPITVACVDYRIEQMLDKLLDNARDFRTPNTVITVRLYRQEYDCHLEVENIGPQIPAIMLDGLFNYMVSGRQITSGKPHLGLGLYVVKLISQFHGGSIMAFNLNQPDGVLFRVQLPILIV